MFTLFPIPIFQKMKSSHTKTKSFARDIFEHYAAAPKVCSPSDNRSKFPYSYVTYFLCPYFRKRTVPKVIYKQWAERLKTRPKGMFNNCNQSKISLFICHIFHIPIFKKMKSLDGNKQLVVLLEKIPAVQKVCSTSDNRLKFPHSCVIYHLLIF